MVFGVVVVGGVVVFVGTVVVSVVVCGGAVVRVGTIDVVDFSVAAPGLGVVVDSNDVVALDDGELVLRPVVRLVPKVVLLAGVDVNV